MTSLGTPSAHTMPGHASQSRSNPGSVHGTGIECEASSREGNPAGATPDLPNPDRTSPDPMYPTDRYRLVTPYSLSR